MTQAKAHSNIALIKYWGKKNEELFLPFNSSLSLTLNELYTITKVSIDPSLSADEFILDGLQQSREETKKISKFVDLFRKNNQFVRINSHNSFPTASGLASSASGYAALAMALNAEFGHHLDKKELSRCARRGSGSATRSLYGGLVVWKKGDDESSYSYPLNVECDLEMIIVLISDQKKEKSSRDMMKLTVDNSRFYQAWVRACDDDFKDMLIAIEKKDYHQIGKITERNAMMMHATMLGLDEPFTYLHPQSLAVIQTVRNLREKGLFGYVTMDAGPNVKILTDSTNRPAILRELKKSYPNLEIIVSQAGPGATLL